MIKFFRTIRFKMMSENLPSRQTSKTVQYFKYAIGEIILVVIGILIALQINNWNENKKARAYERTLLSELQEDVKKDIAFFGDHLLKSRNAKKREIHYYFERMIKGDEAIDNSKFDDHLFWLQYHNTFHVNDGAYESIKSSGIDKISNKEIRNFITNFYEFQIPRFEELIDFSANELLDARESNFPYLLGAPSFKFTNGFEIVKKPVNFDVKTNPDFIRLLEKSMQFEKSSTRYYTSILNMYQELDRLLIIELQLKD